MSEFVDRSILFLTLVNSIVIGSVLLGYGSIVEKDPLVLLIGFMLLGIPFLVIGKMIFDLLVTQPLDKYTDAYKTQLETQLKTSDEHLKETTQKTNRTNMQNYILCISRLSNTFGMESSGRIIEIDA